MLTRLSLSARLPLALSSALLGCLAAAPFALAQGATTPTPSAPVAPQPATIMQIQGNQQFSPLVGKAVDTSGVVTQKRPGGVAVWIQDAKGDGDRTTSDGLYVATAEAVAALGKVAIGDLIRVAGTVEEEQDGKGLPRTRLAKVSKVDVLSRGNALPEPIALTNLPDTELADAVAFWEPLEGMRARVGDSVVVGPTESWGEFSVLAKADAVSGSGYYPNNHHVLIRSLGGDRVDYNPELIVVQGAVGSTPLVRPGDTFSEIVGVVDFYQGTYKVWFDRFEGTVHSLPNAPVSTRNGKLGNARIVCYNLSNLFDFIDTPGKLEERYMPRTNEELDIRLDKMALSIVQELQLPDIIVANEVESANIFQAVGDRVNDLAGTRYRSLSMETYDARGLEVSFLYDENRVQVERYYQMAGPDVDEAFSGVRKPFTPTRQPLVADFRFGQGGPVVTVVANKLKTKRLEDPRYSVNPTHERYTEVQRKLQAKVLRRLANEILGSDPNALLVITGDLGDFRFAEPGEGIDHPMGIIEGLGDEVKMKNLLDLETPGEDFDFVFQGNSVAVTHMFVSPALLRQTVGADLLHFNASFPDELVKDRSTPIRASDRDPIEGRFELEIGKPWPRTRASWSQEP